MSSINVNDIASSAPAPFVETANRERRRGRTGTRPGNSASRIHQPNQSSKNCAYNGVALSNRARAAAHRAFVHISQRRLQHAN